MGKSNSKFSAFYDPPIRDDHTNQRSIAHMYAGGQLADVPTIRMIQVNTDGITYQIHRDYEPIAAAICRWWEGETRLVLEAGGLSSHVDS